MTLFNILFLSFSTLFFFFSLSFNFSFRFLIFPLLFAFDFNRDPSLRCNQGLPRHKVQPLVALFYLSPSE